MTSVTNWADQLEAMLVRFEKVDLGYPKGHNHIVYQAGGNSPQSGIQLPQCLIEFYSEIEEVVLPDIYNGYFIMSLSRLKENATRKQIPTSVDHGENLEEILSFGSTGGGDIFAMPKETGEPIYFLPSFGVTGSTYRTDINPLIVVAENFQDFLRRLADDVKAFVEGTENWHYMTRLPRE